MGRRIKHVSFGYDLTLAGKRERRFSREWQTEADALEALLNRQRDIEAGQVERRHDRSLGQLADAYLAYKEHQRKRSLREDRRILATRILPALGAELPVRRLTSAMIGQYERQRVGEVSAFTVANELTVLRHMLRLGRRWGYVDAVPEIEMPKKPEGRRRYLDEDQIRRLLDACAKSRNPHLSAIVTIALNTGMRKAEVLGLEWERVDLGSARLVLYETKNGAPRGVPINRAVYDALIALQPRSEPAQVTCLGAAMGPRGARFGRRSRRS